jgi:hypothetical protein
MFRQPSNTVTSFDAFKSATSSPVVSHQTSSFRPVQMPSTNPFMQDPYAALAVTNTASNFHSNVVNQAASGGNMFRAPTSGCRSCG